MKLGEKMKRDKSGFPPLISLFLSLLKPEGDFFFFFFI